MCGRRASLSFLDRGGAPLPADVQQLVAAGRCVLEAMYPDVDAGRLPPAQYSALCLLESALNRFPSLVPPFEPGRGPPGAGSSRVFDSGAVPAAETSSETRA